MCFSVCRRASSCCRGWSSARNSTGPCAARRSPAARTARCRGRTRSSAVRTAENRARRSNGALEICRIVPELAEALEARRRGPSAPTMHAPFTAPMETPVTTFSEVGLRLLKPVHQAEQRLDRAPLIGAERTATLEHEADFDAGPVALPSRTAPTICPSHLGGNRRRCARRRAPPG